MSVTAAAPVGTVGTVAGGTGGFNGANVTGVGLAGTLVGLTPVPLAGKVKVAVAAGNTVVEMPSAVV